MSAERRDSSNSWQSDDGKHISDDVEAFLLSRQALNLTPGTLAWYQRCTNSWQAFLLAEGVESTRQVVPTTVRRFLVQLSGDGHTSGGVVTLFTGVKAFLNWYADEYDLTDWNPLIKVRSPKRPQDPLPPVSLGDVWDMLNTMAPGSFNADRDRALLLFLLDTGVRHQELTNLKVGQVNLETGAVTVWQGKGRKTRTVFCGARTRQALQRYFAHRGEPELEQPLWVKEDGDKLTRHGIRQVIRRRAKAAGVQEPGVHAFRRAFAVNCLRNGMNLVSLQRLLGHADLSTVQRYLALVDDDLRRAHSQYGVVDSLSAAD